MDDQWTLETADLQQALEQMHAVRESALKRCRSLIQTSSKCIRHVHRRQFTEAGQLLEEAKSQAETARAELKDYPELFYAGYLQDAEKELVEAAALLAWVSPRLTLAAETVFPSRASLGVGPVAYLNGLGEAASECRRYVLDELRKGNLADSERLLGQMDRIYDDLITFDFPDALTGGLRRTCDALRAVIERTRSDLTMTRIQHDLMEELRKAHKTNVLI